MQGNNCHFYKYHNYCNALTKMVCLGGHCTFFKTEEQFQKDLVKYPPIDYLALYKSRHKNDKK